MSNIDGDTRSSDEHGAVAIIEGLHIDLNKMAQALELFCRLGGGPELQAFADLENDVIVWKNSGEAVTVGDVRRARELLAKYKGVPVSMMHFRKPYVEPEYEALRADLEAVAVAAEKGIEILIAQARLAGQDSEAGRFARHLAKALVRPGVQEALKNART